MLWQASQPGVLSLALGLPAAELFPTAAFADAVEKVLSHDALALQYGPPFQPLKSHIVDLMARRGVTCKEDEVFLTTGAQQAISLLAQVFLSPKGKILIEELAYPGFLQVIKPFAPVTLTVPTHLETGMEIEKLEELLTEGERPDLIYSIADGHNPLSVSMSVEKRLRLVELARYYRIPIIEDGAYGFLQYETPSMPSLRSFEDEWVFSVGSFSKILGPSLRVGWIIAPPGMMDVLSVVKEASDIDTSTFSQRAIAAFLQAGHMPSHLSNLCSEYAKRRDTQVDAIRRYFPPSSAVVRPRGGVFTWIELPSHIDTQELLRTALETEHVAFIPGRAFAVGQSVAVDSCLRLCFCNCAGELIEEGIIRLARALEQFRLREPEHLVNR
jgi:2-aminoadipate transaminase